jgi:hypothetical protein
MPSSGVKQRKFMAAVANNPSFAKKVGVPQSVGQDFSTADKGRKFSKGGDTMAKMNAGMMAMMAKKKDGMHKMPDGKMMKNSAMNMGGMTKMAGGGMPMKDGKPAFIGDGKGAMKHGGSVKKMNMGGMAKGGSASSRADGVATKGKTKGTMIKMKNGGKAC